MSDSLVKGLEALHIDHETFGDLLDLVGSHLQFFTIFCLGRPFTTVKDVLHFALLAIHRGETNDLGKDLMNILTSVLKEGSLYRSPKTAKQFRAIELDFESTWKVPNCHGVIAVLKMTSGPVSNHYNMFFVIDAKFRILDTGIAYGPKTRLPYDTILPTMEVFVHENSLFPSEKLVSGVKYSKRFTFYGYKGFTAKKDLRVATGNPFADEEVRSALKPAEIVLKSFLTRFGILKNGYHSETLSAAVSLHNYFVDNSTSYVKGLMAEDTQSHAPEPEQRAEEDWRDILRMDKGTFDFLLSRCGPLFLADLCPMDPETRLSMVLQFLVTGKGYAPEHERLFANTYSILAETLAEYLRPMPFPQSKWKSVAKGMEQRWGIPNCMGGIATRRVDFKPFTPGQRIPETSADFCFFTGADFGINFMGMQLHWGEIPAKERVSVVDAAFAEYEFKCPRPSVVRGEGKTVPYVFVGGSDVKERPNVVVPLNPAPYTEKELKRGLRPSEIAIELLSNRFRCFQGPMVVESPMNMVAGLMVSCLLHNVLLEKSPEYAKEYKDCHKEK